MSKLKEIDLIKLDHLGYHLMSKLMIHSLNTPWLLKDSI